MIWDSACSYDLAQCCIHYKMSANGMPLYAVVPEQPCWPGKHTPMICPKGSENTILGGSMHSPISLHSAPSCNTGMEELTGSIHDMPYRRRVNYTLLGYTI